MSISQRENYMVKFSDKRLDKRAAQLSSVLYLGGQAVYMRLR